MVLHKIKYKHIGIMFILAGAISGYWTINPKTVILGAISFICCVIVLIAIIGRILHKWNDTIL